MVDIEMYVVLQSVSNRVVQFVGRIQNVVWFVVIVVGNDVVVVQQIGDFIEVWWVIVDVYYQWQIVVFLLNGFGVCQWCNVVFVYYVVVYLCFQVDDKVGMMLYCLFYCGGVDIGYIGQFILCNQFDVGDVEQCINFCCCFMGQLIEVIDVVGVGVVGIDYGGDVGGDVDVIWFIVINW